MGSPETTQVSYLAQEAIHPRVERLLADGCSYLGVGHGKADVRGLLAEAVRKRNRSSIGCEFGHMPHLREGVFKEKYLVPVQLPFGSLKESMGARHWEFH